MAASMNIDLSDISMSSAPLTTQNLTAIVADALKKQSSHFENIVGDLQSQISNLNIKKKTTKEKEVSQSTFSTPMSGRVSKTATTSKSSKSPKSPKTPKTPTPARKKHPLQLHESDIPKDFKSCKDVLYVHIKMMWGLYKTSDVPPTPSANLLKEFYAKFNSSQEIEATLSDPASSDIIAQESILSLKELRVSGGKIARGLGHIDQMSVLYISGVLAKVASGAYNYMNVVLSHTNSISLLLASYNHYVHYVMAARFKSEKAEAGRLARESNRKNIQKSWERLQEARLDYLFRHKKHVPLCYRTLCAEILAHSDDELDKDKGIWIIKMLPYRSKNASKFFRALDAEMLKEARALSNGKGTTKQTRRLPTIPVPSEFTRAPTGLPIDFYDPKWFKTLGPGQQHLVADAQKVCFLLDASQSLSPTRHPDELISDDRFTGKYLDSKLTAYDLPDEEKENVQDENDDDDDEDEEIESEEEKEEDDDDGFYKEGEYGNLYDDEAEEAEDCDE
ncbi:hypothetical protein CROQUDRAFT_104968 [Cronartium quercuum f. sp. fusiforme G11]|uniref:Uncharacterized protein n=1 Tax=Cronartium quercuum f. sp. fusiforme G11 TaxID=708437 RepID=A0A9P6NQ50_9BASI|nr:hypothetical protein CROQUDRAFT_104968 [Cronartium quercuum f. sp. fusiforme G11]